MQFSAIIKKSKSEPQKAIRVGIGLLKGFLAKIRYIMNPNIRIGSNFRVYSWPHISGPGRVVIEDNVSMSLGFLRRPSIITHTKYSVVSIGRGSIMSGTRISCIDSVTVGEEALLGSATIIDSDIIPTADMSVDSKWKEEHVKPIKLGNNIWNGVNSFILGGAVMGDECVLGAGAVILDKEFPDRSIIIGNPGRKIGVARKS